ncbi:MAG: hypothetical protein IPO05_07850 [Flavobacteriales bacterium]|nr:hypothetical protein [Flavobacteriales bacterium]
MGSLVFSTTVALLAPLYTSRLAPLISALNAGAELEELGASTSRRAPGPVVPMPTLPLVATVIWAVLLLVKR